MGEPVEPTLPVDLGGTRMRSAVVTSDGSVTARRSMATPRDAACPDALEELAGDVLARADVAQAVIGVPGRVDHRRGRLEHAPNLPPHWPAAVDEMLLCERLGVAVSLANDADLATIGEGYFGAGRGHADVVYLTVSTGVGAGVLLGGRLVAGARSLADQQVVLVRHAQTEWSRSGRHTGTTDVPLTDGGRAATRLLRDRLAGRQFARVLSSPLRRAAETCRIAGCADEVEIRGDLVEWDYGAYEGRTTADIRRSEPGWDLWRHGPPDGESPEDVARRIDRIIGDLIQTCAQGGDVLVFAHGHSLTALAVRWLGLPIVDGRYLRLGTGSMSTLGWKRDLRVLEAWNDRTHLGPGAQ